jgi:streptomycin 6-kinase
VVTVPENLAWAAEYYGEHKPWVGRLDAVVGEVARRWGLELEEPFQPGGRTAWVAPGRDASGRDLVVKVAWRHPEAEHEADGLRMWAGHGAVRLFGTEDFDEETAILLVEPCVPGTPLSTRPEPEQDQVVAGILRRLWIDPPPGHGVRPLQDMCDLWADEFDAKRAAGLVPLDAGLADEGIALFRSLPATADRHVLLCTDLHAGNVLAAEREPWLVVDPKPYVGDPTYDALQHLFNCGERLLADPPALVGRMAGLLDLDSERLGLWLLARAVQESPHWPEAAEVARRLGRATS